MWLRVPNVNPLLRAEHYLGATGRGEAWGDDRGVIVIARPTSRRLTLPGWYEITRWCITGGPNDGSRQWAVFKRAFREREPEATTIVSYSDPSVGHDGALYRACGWLWAPTWHRLRPPPSGNGSWSDGAHESVKDRWVYPLAPDCEREAILRVEDSGLLRRFPWATYQEPSWRRGRFTGGGGNWKRWQAV